MATLQKSKVDLQSAQVLSREPLGGQDGKWTKLMTVKYKDPLGRERVYESAERTTRRKDSKIDAVGIVTILEKSTGPEILLQKQFRPPVGKVVIEIPAGLVDAGESGDETAVRELKEETGYVGRVVKPEGSDAGGKDAEGVMFNDPGFTNTNLTMVHVAVDLSREENKPENLKTELEENEFIETFSVPIANLFRECRKLESDGYAIDARVGTLAEGWELCRRFG